MQYSVISHMNSRDKTWRRRKRKGGAGIAAGGGGGGGKGINKQTTYCQNLDVIALVLQTATKILQPGLDLKATE